MIYHVFFVVSCLFCTLQLHAQNEPWKRPLMTTTSADGVHFSPPVIFQDSSGVPSVIKWRGDTLIAAFQWFRLPVGSASWDRVAVKFSYNNGGTWSEPQPIQIPSLPTGYQRPFDPTLVVTDSNKIRIFFSSSATMMPADSQINTYSAISSDGLHYNFEPDARFDHPTTHVIDPAVIKFRGLWHYASPYAVPFTTYHAISSDGVHFSQVQDLPADMQHNWTGNYMVNDTGELRFYGCAGPYIWYNSSPNGGQWNGYVNTNISGGDPTVVRTAINNYLMIYTGAPYATGIRSFERDGKLSLYPNPFKNKVFITTTWADKKLTIVITDVTGRTLLNKKLQTDKGGVAELDIPELINGHYFARIICDGENYCFGIIKN